MEQATNHNSVTARSPSFDDLARRSNLTNNQIGFWLGQHLSPSSSIYNMGQVYHLPFEVDVEAFRAAFRTLVHRSDALRTTFAVTEEVPHQTVTDRFDYEVPIVDLSAHDSPQDQLQEWCEQRISLPMNVAEACFDSALIRLNHTHWAWYFCIHHLIGDGTSVELIFQYVGRLYAEAARGGRGDLPGLPQFASYIQQEKEYRNSAECQRDAAFWAARRAAPCPSVPFYGNSRVDTENLCVRTHRVLERHQTDELLQVASRTLGIGISAELNALAAYLAVMAAYLLRTSGLNKLVVGVPFHNRPSRKDKEVIGLLMELVSLELDVSPEDSFSTLLYRAKSEILAVLRHYRFGLTNSMRARNYDVMLNLLPSSTDKFAGEPVRTDWIHSGEWNECLTVQVQRTTEGDKIYFDMNREVFRDGLAENAPEHFISLLRALVNDPYRAIRDADFLTSAERRVLNQKLRNTGRRVTTDETIVSHFEAVADRNPQATAVVQGERMIDYRTLDRMSNRFAALLRARGVSKGEHVGVCMERSIERIAVILGVLKAGGAYVPVDEAWPSSRLQMTVDDASVRKIITQTANVELLSDVINVEVLDVDALAEEVSRQPDGRFTLRGHSSDTAYINFTSGSTGRPKGVLVPHRGVIRLTTAADYIELDETTVTLHMSSISFDASTFEIWGALLCGGTVALPPSGLPDARMIRHCVETFGVNELFVTTSLFNTLVEEDVQVFSGLRNLLTGGEAASVSHVKKAAAALSNTRIVNVYGPTECTTFATHYSVPADLQPGVPVPIGTPISNTACFVLDESLQDVPPGGTGELYLGGDGLALGYAAQETLTAERFIALPFHGNERAYKTGDIVRIQEDGNLVFIGRRDNQVKVRGFRIELEEVELAVNRTKEVTRAVVILHEARDGSKGLAVYAIPSTPDVTSAHLRAALRAHLPQAMLPRWIVFVSNLPLGATGKIDRSQLPDPAGMDGAVRLTQPQSDVERRLLQLWQDVLGTVEVDTETNFFDLGGDSIRAIQLAARAAAHGIQFEATDLFQFQTIAELALAVEDCDAGKKTRPERDTRHDPNQMAQAELDAMLSELF